MLTLPQILRVLEFLPHHLLPILLLVTDYIRQELRFLFVFPRDLVLIFRVGLNHNLVLVVNSSTRATSHHIMRLLRLLLFLHV